MSELRLAITGHRRLSPESATGQPIDLEALAAAFVQRAMRWARAGGHTTVVIITGGALGVDQAVAEAVERTSPSDDIRLVSRIVLPFPVAVMGRRWAPADRARLNRLIGAAESLTILGETYGVWLYQRRNEAMVDAADGLVAFWNGARKGGTYNCVAYALRRGMRVRNALRGYAEVGIDEI